MIRLLSGFIALPAVLALTLLAPPQGISEDRKDEEKGSHGNQKDPGNQPQPRLALPKPHRNIHRSASLVLLDSGGVQTTADIGIHPQNR